MDRTADGALDGFAPIGQLITALAREHPERDAVLSVHADDTVTGLTWEQLDSTTNSAARTMADHGVDGSTNVIVRLPNGIPHVVATIAAWKLGALVIPVNPGLSGREHGELLSKVPDAVVVGEGTGGIDAHELLREGDGAPLPPPGTPPRVAALTGGSTGAPRIVLRRPWVYDPRTMRPAWPPIAGMAPGQTQLVTLPLFHGGFLGLHKGLAMGHTVIVMDVFSPTRFLRLVERYQVNFAVLVPTLMRAIAGVKDVERYDLGSIQALHHGAGRCPEDVKRRWLRLVAPERVFEEYASVDGTGHLMIRGDEWLAHPGSVGRASGDLAVRVLDDSGADAPVGQVGEVYMRGRGPAQPSYVGGGPPLREREGFVTVGDLGYLDADGYLHLVDRRVDVINVGGINVYPAEVEQVLLELEWVADAAVVGRPDDLLGQHVHAVVVPADGAGATVERLDAHCRTRLARSKLPASYELVASLPRNEAGKLRRADL